jgi:hypothetical protein
MRTFTITDGKNIFFSPQAAENTPNFRRVAHGPAHFPLALMRTSNRLMNIFHNSVAESTTAAGRNCPASKIRKKN